MAMARHMPPMEPRWPNWLRAWTSAPPPRPLLPNEDHSLTAWCAMAANDLALAELANTVRVGWNSRMQTTAGRAWWPNRLIELNPKLHACGEDALWRTLKHELAHLIAYERSGRRHIAPHGPEWAAACADLGIPGERACHSLPFKRRQIQRNHSYVCPNCLATLDRVKPLLRPVACSPCCRKFNNGRYHDRFRWVKNPAA